MAFAFVQVKQGTGASETAIITPDAAIGAGHLVVVSIKIANGGADVSSVVDSAGNTYAAAGHFHDTSNAYTFALWYGVAVTGGATTVTVTWNVAVAGRITVEEFSGNQATNAATFDQYQTATSDSGTATSGAVSSFNPSATGNLITAMYGLGVGGSATAGSGYTLSLNNTSLSNEYKLSSAASETAPMSWANNVIWTALVGSFKPAAATGGIGLAGVNAGIGRGIGLGISNVG